MVILLIIHLQMYSWKAEQENGQKKTMVRMVIYLPSRDLEKNNHASSEKST